ncbi:hypothetical protein DENSPDRAFT_816810 [Dentipellis sp. KUC8613]|nr:hypothetical protein DENSPDRAFT_816810 [Dentipellis sp. KUC8613]
MTATTADLDLELPVATLLRTGTAAAHTSAETSQGAGWLTRGELDKEEYVRFLIMLYHVYHTLEQALDQHASHPVLSPIYNPTLLARTAPLYSDISYLLDTPPAALPEHPLFSELQTSPHPALAEYTARLRTLAAAPNPAPLLAHAYVRYLGDLSGGQVIRRRVAKAYGLEDEGGEGVRFYQFDKLGGGGEAGLGDMRKIKDWYRDGMNSGVADDKDLKVTILAEANKAFELNNGLFASLKAPSSPPSSPPSPSPAEPISTTTPQQSTHAPMEYEKDDKKKSEYPIQVPSTQQDSNLISVSSVAAFIIAMGLAHFVLVIGGFTGAKGWEKLEAVQRWFEGLVQ